MLFLAHFYVVSEISMAFSRPKDLSTPTLAARAWEGGNEIPHTTSVELESGGCRHWNGQMQIKRRFNSKKIIKKCLFESEGV